MKKLLILALSALWAFQAMGQDRLTSDQFEDQLQEILIKQSDLVKNKDYAQAEKTSHEALALFAKLSPEDLEEFLSIKPMLTYDLSCIYALQK